MVHDLWRKKALDGTYTVILLLQFMCFIKSPKSVEILFGWVYLKKKRLVCKQIYYLQVTNQIENNQGQQNITASYEWVSVCVCVCVFACVTNIYIYIYIYIYTN